MLRLSAPAARLQSIAVRVGIKFTRSAHSATLSSLATAQTVPDAGKPGFETALYGPLTGVSAVPPGDKVYIAMSGGVDSSTTAAMLVRALGASRVEGVFMHNWSTGAKCQEASWRAVQRISAVLGVQCRRVDLERDYWTDVFEPMLAAYQRGDTPNPDVACNQQIKFGGLMQELRRHDPGVKWLATGHYAGLSRDRLVHRASYMPKDQSYYLATVAPNTLQKSLFPLAHLSKPQVRQLAAEFGLVEVAQKPDSQGLCFVEQQDEFGQRGFRKFLGEYLTEEPGPVVLASDPSVVVGEHRGLWSHTIGQRASVPMPQSIPEMRGQWFVVAKDVAKNALLIDRGNDSPYLYVSRVGCANFVWHRRPTDLTGIYAQYRSLQEPWKVAEIDDLSGEGVSVSFTTPRRAVASGQYLVLYDNDVVIGAGAITDTATAV